jgi:hypothetical protein
VVNGLNLMMNDDDVYVLLVSMVFVDLCHEVMVIENLGFVVVNYPLPVVDMDYVIDFYNTQKNNIIYTE